MPTNAIHMLDSGEIEQIFERECQEDKEWEQKKIAVNLAVGFSMKVTCYYNKVKNTVIIASPLSTMLAENSDCIEPDFASSVVAIKHALRVENANLCGVLIGTGATERHYVAFYQDKHNEMAIFDSKFSDPRRFLSTSSAPRWWQKIGGIIVSIFDFVRTSLGFGIKLNSTFNGMDVEVHRLGTQSILDGKSCGYHSGGAVLEMKDFIHQNNDPISLEQMVERVLTDKDTMMGRAETALTLDVREKAHPRSKQNPMIRLGKPVENKLAHDMAHYGISTKPTLPLLNTTHSLEVAETGMRPDVNRRGP